MELTKWLFCHAYSNLSFVWEDMVNVLTENFNNVEDTKKSKISLIENTVLQQLIVHRILWHFLVSSIKWISITKLDFFIVLVPQMIRYADFNCIKRCF